MVRGGTCTIKWPAPSETLDCKQSCKGGDTPAEADKCQSFLDSAKTEKYLSSGDKPCVAAGCYWMSGTISIRGNCKKRPEWASPPKSGDVCSINQDEDSCPNLLCQWQKGSLYGGECACDCSKPPRPGPVLDDVACEQELCQRCIVDNGASLIDWQLDFEDRVSVCLSVYLSVCLSVYLSE